MTRGYRLADVSAVEPMMFFRLVWAAVLGLVIFGEIPAIATWIGGLLIVAATTLLTRRESRAARRDQAASTPS